MKILSPEHIHCLDAATLKSQEISSLELMERAAQACINWILKRFDHKHKITVFCGVGNNGGDGLAIANGLFLNGYQVRCVVVHFSKNRSADFQQNFARLKKLNTELLEVWESIEFPNFDDSHILIDAIFGIGLKRAIKGFSAELIDSINTASSSIIAIDIPSGLYAHEATPKNAPRIQANYTLTFHAPKLAFMLPENFAVVGEFHILDIGLDQEFAAELRTLFTYIDLSLVKQLFRPRPKFSHKGTFGHALIMGGSFGKIGAVVLASTAALKSGSGLVSAYVPRCAYEILQITVPEAMVEVDAEKELHYFNYGSSPTVIGIGPGLGISEKTRSGFDKFLRENELPLVLDADALNMLSLHKELLNVLPRHTILTPHPKEFKRLVGPWKSDMHKLELARELSKAFDLIIVLKGAHTAIVDRDAIYFNATGNSGLATGGSGDVLLGMITGLMAQGYKAVNAAILGVYLHGLAADIGVEKSSKEAFTASDISVNLGYAFQRIS